MLRVLSCAFRADPAQTLRGLFWYLRGKRVRGYNLMKSAAARSPAYYRLWIKVAEPRLVQEYCAAAGTAQPVEVAAAIIGAERDPAGAERTRRSLAAAFDGAAALLQLDAADAFAALPSPGSWFIALAAGDLISPATGAALAAANAANPGAEILFWDEDRLTGDRRLDPWMRAEWDELLLQQPNWLCGAAAVRVPAGILPSTVRKPLDLQVHVAKRSTGAAVHIPLVLTHRGQAIELSGGPLIPAAPADGWPDVSIIIPTRDRVELLDSCIHSLKLLDYPGRIELIVADNGSTEDATREFLDRFAAEGGKVVDCAGPFNFSAINNRAVAAASGALVCLLNNDIEALNGSWLTAMVRHAVCPDVGAVGAMLLYPDGTIQHAGVAVGIGGAAGHVYRGIDPAALGNGACHRTTRRVSIVTAACLVVRRETYLRAGGLDEQAFAVAFNDVDFCLRLDRSGLRNIYVAEARLIHHESKSRGNDMHASNYARYRQELAQLQARWNTLEARDRWHSPLIRRAGEDFVLDIG